jgi:hypothetical protein
LGDCPDASEDARDVPQDVVVCDAEDGETTPGDDVVALPIIFELVLMNRPVDFDDEFERVAVEIGDEAIDDLLAAELELWKRLARRCCQRHFSASVICRRSLFARSRLSGVMRWVRRMLSMTGP